MYLLDTRRFFLETEEKNTKVIYWKETAYWIILGLIIFLAIFIRWRANFNGKLMPGVNALYYPIQVRSLIENGHLAFSDLPFLFWLEALIARLLFLFNLGNLSDCIILASKGVDSILPTFSAIPVFLLANEWQNNDSKIKWFTLIPSAFSVFYFSALVMTSDFQKNAVGIVGVYFFAYFLYKSLQSNEWKYYALAGISFILVSLTHIGSLGLALSFLLIVTIALLLSGRIKKRIILIGSIIVILALIGILGFLYLFIDNVRIERLFGAIFQLKLFENNLISAIINKYPISISPPDIANIIVITAIAIFGLVLIIRKKDSLQKPKRLIVIGSIVTSLIMSSLIIGQEWFCRLLMMAYVPASLILAFLLTELNGRVIRRFVSSFAITLVFISIIIGFVAERPSSISEESYLELNQIRQVIDKPDNTLIVARHGLEWWVAWILRTRVAQDKSISPDTWAHYDTILFIEQLAGSFGFGPSGPFGDPFPEVKIPPDAKIIYEGQYFRLAKVLTPPPL
ncbi:MAG: glycosyltransferase family 39 protein [Candidatus Poribacteria bacterium]